MKKNFESFRTKKFKWLMICDSLVNLKPYFFRLCKSAASIHESNVFYTLVYMRWISHFTRTSSTLCFAILLLSVLSWLNDLIDRVTISERNSHSSPKGYKVSGTSLQHCKTQQRVCRIWLENQTSWFQWSVVTIHELFMFDSLGTNRPFTDWKSLQWRSKMWWILAWTGYRRLL